jgi:uncharacterized protein YjbI with pentapeptide repeats
MHDSRRYHIPIVGVLTTFVRYHPGSSQAKAAGSITDATVEDGRQDEEASRRQRKERPPPGVQAALNVLGRRPRRAEPDRLRLSDSYLRGALLRKARLQQGENLRGVLLRKARLQGAHKRQGVNLRYANLTDAHLEEAHLEGASLRKAILVEAGLEGAHLEGASLPKAILTAADLEGAHMKRASLSKRTYAVPSCMTPT